VLRERKLDLDGRQYLADFVMKLPRNAAAFFLLGREQL